MNRSRGFTLVETVIAVTVLSLIVLATLTAMRSFARIQEKVNSTAATTAEMRQVSEFLRLGLQQAQPAPESSGGSVFFSAPDELAWWAPLGGVEGLAGLRQYRVFLDDDSTLRIAFGPVDGEASYDDSDAYVLLESVDEFRVFVRPGFEDDWLTGGDGETEAIPRLVMIQLLVAGVEWPVIIAAPDRLGGEL